MAISPLQLARVSDFMSSTIVAGQLNSTQQQLLVVEEQLSTGHQFQQPSDNLTQTTIAIQLQRTLTQSQTYLGNLSTAQSQLGEVDNSLSSLTTLVQQAQTIASADVNSDVSSSQRQADAQVIDSIFTQALNIGNTQLNGQFLFGGDKSTTAPFVQQNGGVQFVGSNNVLENTIADGTNLAFMVQRL